MKTIGFIGIGNMGSGIVANIKKAGYPLVVYDVRREALQPLAAQGMRIAASPAEVAKLSDIIFSSLPGPKEVEEVALGKEGILSAIKPSGVYVEMSTSSPTVIHNLEKPFLQKKAHVLDAPVSGGKMGAADGTLSILVGGDKAVFEEVRPVLESFGRSIYHTGGLGTGLIVKLVHNMIGSVVSQALSEGFTLGVKAGADPLVLLECLRTGGLGRMLTLHHTVPEVIFKGAFDHVGMNLNMAAKDISLATELGREFKVPLPMTTLAEQIAITAVNRGWGLKDECIRHVLQEEAAGVQVRA